MKQVIQKWFEQYFGNEEAVLLTVILLVSLVVMATLGTVLGPVFTALILAFLLQGLVNTLRRYGLSRILAIMATYLLFVLGFIAVLVILIPIVGRQTSLLLGELPNMVGKLRELAVTWPDKYSDYITPDQFQMIWGRVSQEMANLAEQVLSLSLSSFPGLLAIMIYLFLVPLLVLFMLKDKDILIGFLSNMLPKERTVMTTIWSEMDIQFANYVRGKAIEILIVGTVAFVAFLLLGLNYAALLALLVGLSVLIPYIGATVVTIPVLLVGYVQWGYSEDFFWLFMVYGLIQFLDGNVLVPLLFSEVVNLHPVAIIIAVLFFGGIWGFWGVFFAIPLATLVKAIYNAWPRHGDTQVNNAELDSATE
ncbi:MAG: AI-2E family transporter [Porticoccaceae bacterium]|nr:AI-2E family transporter [Porticoccaceae bacterium]MDG1307715.1 AI-2E family transporter [Porticoccaceae bacterium]